ncbi:MAG: hypothetical protein IJN26_00065 [Bacteroidales bacterium]|nr:hypothetical protein [Bacteroidales bacterium]
MKISTVFMSLLLSFIILLADIPQELYIQYCTKEVMDSVYLASADQAKIDYKDDLESGTDFLIAYWAFNENLINLSAYQIQKALQSEITDETLMADCYSLASLVFRLKGELATAIEYAEKCLHIDRKQNNQEGLSSSLNTIAGLYLMHGEPVNAKKYIDEAILIETKLNRSSSLAVRYGLASEVYLKLGETQKALDFADEALRLDSLDNSIAKTAVRRSQKAAILIELKQYGDANRELQQALPVFLQQNNHNSLAITYCQLGEIAAVNQEVAASEDYFEKAISLCKEINHIYMESRARNGLYKLFKEIDNRKSLYHLEEHIKLLQIINDEKAAELMQSFTVKYDTLEKEQAILHQEEMLKWRSFLIILLITLQVLLCVLLYISRKTTKITNERNAMLVKAIYDKSRLLAIASSNIPKSIRDEIMSITSDTTDIPEIKLTRRELEIANLCTKGLLNKEIAEQLHISQRTVENHKNNLFKKLGINNTVELMRYMQRAMNNSDTTED